MKKKTIFSFFHTVNRQNFIFILVTDEINIYTFCCLSCVDEKHTDTTKKQTTSKLCQQLADNNLPQLFSRPAAGGEECNNFCLNLKLSVCTADFGQWSHATIIRRLMDTKMCMRCPLEMERPRLSFNYLHLLTYSLPVNCQQTYICILGVYGEFRH